ncbi:type I secretion outer membrane protein, TolC family protein [Asticcacaulis biprosthecium C19]|uniref:Type I secretion outer membrane protein, TolC family protein n=2 Tax=Asticcacaulis biprosthecium TaxID=76891 RepID=F4QQ63_9CAUL|nr:type I secretion outer membrane protein, TolC family protein [Asticcacaulis biprosthecium C19]
MMTMLKFGRSFSSGLASGLALGLGTLVTASVLALGAATAVSAESLNEAIAQAYNQNPTLARARAAQRAADERYVQTRSEFGPSLSVGGSVNYTDTDTSFQPGNQRSNTSLSVSADQNIFTSGGLTNSLRASEANIRAGQQDLRSTESQVLLDVIQVYTAVRRDQQALKISQDNYDILKQQLEQTQAQFDAGQLTRTDVAQSQARLSASAASLAQAQAQLDADRAQYVAIVGQAPIGLEAEPVLPGLPADFNTALQTAERNNPDLQASLYAEDAAKANLGAARSVFGPTVSLGAVYSGTTPTDDLGGFGDAAGATATLRFNVPLFSAGLNGSRVREAAENYNAQKISTEITRRAVVSSVSQAWSQMIAARSAVSSNQEQVRAAQVAAEGVKTEQQVGLRTNIEVLNAQQELKSAQLQLLEAERTQYVAASQLLSVMGGMTVQAFVPSIEVYDPQENFNNVKSKGWTPLEPVSRALDGLAAGGSK